MIAIDRQNILPRINSKTLEAEIRVGCAIDVASIIGLIAVFFLAFFASAELLMWA
jgi:hypothetical protein